MTDLDLSPMRYSLELVVTLGEVSGYRPTFPHFWAGIPPFFDTKPQQWLTHTDWDRETFERFELEGMPFSTIWAAAARFELHGPAGEVIPVRKGQMAVFRGNWGHCGGRHCSSQLRVHAFGRRIGSNLRAPQNVFGYQ